MKAPLWTLSGVLLVLTLTACSPEPQVNTPAVEQAASEAAVEQIRLEGESEKLAIHLPDCEGNNCPELTIERLSTNQPVVDAWVDAQIVDFLEQQLAMLPAAQNTAASEVQSQTSEPPLNAKTRLEQKIAPYVAAFALLDQELKQLSANHQVSMMIKPRILHDQAERATVVLNSSSYLGGAHGSSAQQYANFNLKENRQILLKEVILDQQKFEQVAHRHFSSWVMDSKLANTVAEYEQAWKFHLSDNFYFAQDGLILQYAEYEIGPYVAGLPKLLLPYEELQGIIGPEYLPPVSNVAE